MTDIIIIGSGPGGYETAEYAAKQGLSVAIIERADAGGTCLNCGCIPTKSLCHDAESKLLDNADDAMRETLFANAMERKNAVVAQLRNGVEQLMQQPGIIYIKGEGKITGEKTVEVKLAEGGTETLMCDKAIIIATGSRSKMPPVEGITNSCVVTSTELLNISKAPKRLCIVGAGVIGMEFASVFNRFGSEVTVIEFMKECLPTMDSDIAKRLRKLLEKRGITFHLASGVKAISETGVATFEKKGKELTAEADIVLVATGRAANVEGIGLETVGIECDRRGICVDENMRTNVESIYAIGDVNGRQMLAHAATAQGRRAINNILGIKDNIRFDIMPAAVFTAPEAASVGLTQQQCTDQEIESTCRKAYWRANGRALAMEADEGMIKLIADSNDKIIGCHAYGEGAAAIIQEAATLMNMNATVAQLRDIIHIHPTLSEILKDAAI